MKVILVTKRIMVAMAAGAALLLGSCGNNATEKAPDVSGIKVALQTQRFDKDIYAIDTNHIAEGLLQLKQKYPDFMEFYLDTVMGFGIRGNYSDTARAIRESIHEYLTYKDYKLLQDSINHYYPDTKAVDEKLTSAFTYMKHYLPAVSTPKIIYANHILLNIPPVLCVDSNITLVCLDMFLGGQFPYYVSVGVPAYMAPHLTRDYIPVAVFRTTYESLYPYDPTEQPLIEQMIYYGREQYFLHKVMPGVPDSVLFGFTGRQIKWCETNEAAIYNYFVQNSLLYNKRDAEVRPYVVDGPFARNLGTASEPGTTPGNVGSWMGYRIVSSYMANNSKMTLKELLDMKVDGNLFLEAAKYRPK